MNKCCFVESLDLTQFNVFVLVAQDSDSSFLSDRFPEIAGNKNLATKVKNLTYNEITHFDLNINDKFIEVIVAGAGKRNALSISSIEKLGGYIYSKIESTNANICILNNIESVGTESAAARIASGMFLKSWKFDKYISNKQPEKILSITCKTNYLQINANIYKELNNINSGVLSVRNMVTEPANIMTPDKLKEIALELEEIGVKVSVFDKKHMEKLGMNALLGVAKGSDTPPYTVIMEYLNSNSDDKVALVGKGVTFDAGGICLKPSKGMAFSTVTSTSTLSPISP